ncbi:MAG: toll/interleukin-1 receptor domain-containing protein [Lachnospiraceae bacterium]|nr:toll/interleukin-1 receptor domain-containing protein [Lachnospiraceae bacterium]
MKIEAINCQSCGGVLKVNSSVCTCEFCGVTNIICGETGNYINALNRANKLRQQCEFDRAFEIYEEILEVNPPFADILWSETLCDYGIEYVEDPLTGKYLPTLHRIKDESILASRFYLDALELCDEDQREKIRACAEEIYKIQEEYLNIAANEKPYDVFICYKETDNGQQTEDSKVGMKLYDKLTKMGYKVFFAKVTLKDKLGIEFEPYIFAAIKSAPVMVVIGTKAEYFEATWVKNEWSRFLRLKEKDPKKQIFFACDDISDLPKAFVRKQAQILEDDSSIDNLVNNIYNYLKPVGGAADYSKNKSSIPSRTKVKCPHCGRLQEKNMFGCIFCHRQF